MRKQSYENEFIHLRNTKVYIDLFSPDYKVYLIKGLQRIKGKDVNI